MMRKPALIIVVSLFLAVLACADSKLSDQEKSNKVDAMYESYKSAFPEVKDITAEQALKISEQERILFVDVREEKEQAVSMLPNAVPHEQFLKNVKKYKDHKIIGYCTISYRSGVLAQQLSKQGVEMVNMRGGVLAWLHAGGKVYKEGKPVSQVHVYGGKWDLAPSAYETIY
ncbi:rhodanese-like domain-containing protein [Thermodesulfobacteriota bacterium]